MTEENETQADLQDDVHAASAWEFPDDPPGPDEVMRRLKELPDWYGELRPEDYFDYVQALPQRKKIKDTDGSEKHKNMWTVYVTVAGRQAAINAAAARHGWRVDFEPEPVTPTGVPGYLQFDKERIVYREYTVLYDREGRILGRKPGTAWVPGEGGAGAIRSNRFEKVETSARGRAIAAWGIGVLPGSGVASLDEMTTAQELTKVVQMTPHGQRVPKNKDDVLDDARIAIAEYQSLTGTGDDEMFQKVYQFCVQRFDKQVTRNESGTVEFGRMKMGEITLFTNALRQQITQVQRNQPL